MTNFSLFSDSLSGTKVYLFHSVSSLLAHSDIIHADGSLTEIVERNRSTIMKEWRLVYSKAGLEDYASRIGELFCFLVSIEVMSIRLIAENRLLTEGGIIVA